MIVIRLSRITRSELVLVLYMGYQKPIENGELCDPYYRNAHIQLAKWFDKKLKPLNLSQYTAKDTGCELTNEMYP